MWVPEPDEKDTEGGRKGGCLSQMRTYGASKKSGKHILEMNQDGTFPNLIKNTGGAPCRAIYLLKRIMYYSSITKTSSKTLFSDAIYNRLLTCSAVDC